MGCFFNFITFVIFGIYIAETIGRGIIDISIIDNDIILGALISAIMWDIFTWYYGLPTSSSHALIGGLIGSALIKTCFQSLILNGIFKTDVFIFLSPLIGLFLGALIGIIIFSIFKKSEPHNPDNVF